MTGGFATGIPIAVMVSGGQSGESPQHFQLPPTQAPGATPTRGPIADAERTVTVLANFAPVADKMLADWASGTAQRDLSHDLDTEELPLTHIGKPHRRSRSPPPVMGHEARTGRGPDSRTLAQPYGAPLVRSPQELWTNLVRAFLRAQHAERIRNMTCERVLGLC